MSTVIEWAAQNPGVAVSRLMILVGFLILFIPGLWYWVDKGILPLRERWDGWRRWPSSNWIESLFVTFFMLLLLLAWVRTAIFVW